ncbi:hypothetical protein R5576_06390 [Xanthomonas euvesicatoria]|uniref:Uncharacterized protein n=1 Tax=Xanthomonas euvesicatoria TaxID=456327 RepID=A0AAX4FGG5_XANEU|nr:hypothetical protein [Xanthomonas euvesicatoria]WOP53523.1 hypothetical protein R5576_06390 [Xanthomonas euvesicatoria]WOP55566.1 hypothetical protein R5577_15065 [Xanthomonas euvesicatoria]
MFDNGLLRAAEVVVAEDAAEQFVSGEDIDLGYRAGQALAGWHGSSCAQWQIGDCRDVLYVGAQGTH